MYQNVAPAPRKRRTWPIVLAIIAGVFVLLCGVGVILVAVAGGGDKAPTSGGASAAGKVGPVPAGMNQPARDGQFEFVVTKVQCAVPQVGDKILSKKPQGQFCLVTVKVTNIGAEARTLSASNQYAFNNAEKPVRYDADGEAAIYLPDAGHALYEAINPGNSVIGTLVFDIPVGAKLAKLELHDSAFSGGVAVSLPV